MVINDRLALFLLTVGLLLVTTDRAVLAEPQDYVIDPDHLSVGFLVSHVGYAKTLGLFRDGGGEFTFDESTGELSDLRVVVNTNSIFTNHDKRDEHLRSEDFLNTEQFPEMVFTAKDAQRTGENTFQVVGDLTLLGETKPLTLDVTWNKSDTYPFRPGVYIFKPYVLGASARGTLRRSDYGMTYAVADGLVGDEVELLIEFEARRE